MRESVDDRRQRRRARNEARREQHHQQRRLGEKADEHLAARAEAAECGPDIHRGERDEDTGERKQADQRDGIGGAGERQIGGKRGDDRRGQCHRAEHDIGRKPENGRRVFGDHRVLMEKLPDRTVRCEQRRSAPVREPRAALVDPADERRREQQRDRKLQQLGQETARRHWVLN